MAQRLRLSGVEGKVLNDNAALPATIGFRRRAALQPVEQLANRKPLQPLRIIDRPDRDRFLARLGAGRRALQVSAIALQFDIDLGHDVS